MNNGIVIKLRRLWLYLSCCVSNRFFAKSTYQELTLDKMSPKKYRELNNAQQDMFLERLNIMLSKKQEEAITRAKVVEKHGGTLLGQDNLNWFEFTFQAEFHFRDGRYRIVTPVLTDISNIDETIEIKSEAQHQNWCRLLRWLYQEIDDKRKIFDLDFIWFSVQSEFVEREEIGIRNFEKVS